MSASRIMNLIALERSRMVPRILDMPNVLRCGGVFALANPLSIFATILSLAETAVFSESADCRPKWSATRPLFAGYFSRGNQELLPRS